MRRLLLFEFFHADERAYRGAPDSLQQEGRAMLRALAEDAARIADLEVTLLLCASARDFLTPPASAITPCASDSLISQLPELCAAFDLVLPVAPESEGLLQQIAYAVPDSCVTLLPSREVVSHCCDKLATYQWLKDRCPMLPTRTGTADQTAAEWIWKPRLGAGCEGIRRTPPADRVEDWIIQPLLDARSLSVGILGNGHTHLLLPVAEQHISWESKRPEYLGGEVPVPVSSKVQAQASRIVESLLDQTGAFRGYLGIDLLVTQDDEVLLNEINPRVCTSYCGYRKVAPCNLLDWILSDRTPFPFPVLNRVVFDATGMVRIQLASTLSPDSDAIG